MFVVCVAACHPLLSFGCEQCIALRQGLGRFKGAISALAIGVVLSPILQALWLQCALPRPPPRCHPAVPNRSLPESSKPPTRSDALPIAQILWFIDEALFPGYKSVRIEDPVFIAAPPRSGSTTLHRALTADSEEFVAPTLADLVVPIIPITAALNWVRETPWLYNSVLAAGDFVVKSFGLELGEVRTRTWMRTPVPRGGPALGPCPRLSRRLAVVSRCAARLDRRRQTMVESGLRAARCEPCSPCAGCEAAPDGPYGARGRRPVHARAPCHGRAWLVRSSVPACAAQVTGSLMRLGVCIRPACDSLA